MFVIDLYLLFYVIYIDLFIVYKIICLKLKLDMKT